MARKITPAFANACKAEYAAFMKNLGINVNKNQTNTITFNTAELQAYLQDNNVFENSDEIKVFLGVYPEDSPGVYPSTQPGKITAIIWPHKNGQPATFLKEGNNGASGAPIDPFNVGELSP